MDWKQFIASLVENLAWPAVVIVAVLSFRKNLSSLIDSVEEWTGFGQTFRRRLDKTSEDVEALQASSQTAPEPSAADEMYDMLFSTSPSVAITEAFDEVEKVLSEFRTVFTMPSQYNLGAIVKFLAKRGIIDKPTHRLFNNLYEARNAAVHGRSEHLTTSDAREFWRQAHVLAQTLRGILEKLKKDPPPKSEG